jgi:hypothetical protein
MIDRYVDGEPAAELLERRWFAALRAARSVQAECEVLLGVMELTEDSWRRARARLVELETLRDALGEQLTCVDGQQHSVTRPAPPAVLSAA